MEKEKRKLFDLTALGQVSVSDFLSCLWSATFASTIFVGLIFVIGALFTTAGDAINEQIGIETDVFAKIISYVVLTILGLAVVFRILKKGISRTFYDIGKWFLEVSEYRSIDIAILISIIIMPIAAVNYISIPAWLVWAYFFVALTAAIFFALIPQKAGKTRNELDNDM